MSSIFIKEHPSLVGKKVNIEFGNREINVDLRELFETQLDKSKVKEAINKILSTNLKKNDCYCDGLFEGTCDTCIRNDLKRELGLE